MQPRAPKWGATNFGGETNMDISILDGASDSPGIGTLLEQARASVRGGRLSEARRTCETLVETHPEQPDGWYLLGMTALRDGELDTAHTHLSRAVDMRRGYAPYRAALGQALRKLGDPEGAERQFRDAGPSTRARTRLPSGSRARWPRADSGAMPRRSSAWRSDCCGGPWAGTSPAGFSHTWPACRRSCAPCLAAVRLDLSLPP